MLIVQETLVRGSRQVIIMAGTWVHARLYVDHGKVATLESWKGKTMAGAKRWAAKVLGLEGGA